MFRKILFVLTLAIIIIAGIPAVSTPVSAAPEGMTITVNDTADLPDAHAGDGICSTQNNTCTLRAAIMEANKHSGTDILKLQANATYVLARAGADDNAKKGDLDIRESINLFGNGATIDANGGVTHDRVFHFLANPDQFSQIENLTIKGGSTTANGGGIWNQSNLTLKVVTVTSNHADGQGGGIANEATLNLERSTLDNNTSHLDGGGIWNDGTSVLITASTFAFNQADRHGGAIYNSPKPITIVHSTIAYNSADVNHDDDGVGGGIYNQASGTVTLGNTLLGKNANTEAFLWKWDDCFGAMDSTGWNLVYYNTQCVISAVNNLNNFDPGLDTFGDHGGPTKTFSLAAGSPAIDNGNPDNCQAGDTPSLMQEQRFYLRSADGNADTVARCDIGAYEFNAANAGLVGCGVPGPFDAIISSPSDKEIFAATQVTIQYSVHCATTYNLIIRQDTKQGFIADKVKGLGIQQYTTAKLTKGHKYFVRVTGCNKNGCVKSAWRGFSIKP